MSTRTLVMGALVCAWAVFPAAAGAATFTVTGTGDAGPGTLRQAIADAEAATGPDDVVVPAGTIRLQSALPAVTQELTITGAGPDATLVERNGGAPHRLLDIQAGADVTIRGLTLAGGLVDDGGGAIHSAGTLALHECVVRDATAERSTPGPDVEGGAIRSSGHLTVDGCAFEDNAARVHVSDGDQGPHANGGAIAAVGGSLTVRDTTFTGNVAAMDGNSAYPWASGGAVYATVPQSHTRTTFTQNVSTADSTCSNCVSDLSRGGAIVANGAAIELTDSTVTANRASAGVRANVSGGGICAVLATVTVRGSTVADNEARAPSGGDASGGGLSLISPPAGGRIERSTISGNTAHATGRTRAGGLDVFNGTLTVTGTTIVANSATGPTASGGGMGTANRGTATLGGSIVAGNTAAGTPDVGLPLLSLGGNVIGVGDGVTKLEASDRIGTAAAPLDPRLGPLADNGGLTLTHLPLAGSPAVDAAAAHGATTDQRGAPRPVDDPAVANGAGGDGSDAGAVERPLPTPTPNPTPTPDPTPDPPPAAPAPEPPALPPASQAGPRLGLASRKAIRAGRSGRVRLRLRCRDAACRGRLSGPGVRTVAVDLAAGRTRAYTVRLRRATRRKLARRQRLTLPLRWRPAGGRPTTVRVKLLAPGVSR